MMRRPSVLTLAIALAAGLLGSCAGDPQPSGGHGRIISPASIRALWVDSWNPGIYSQPECDRMIDTALAQGFNTLIVEVRKVGDAYYSSHIEPRGLVAGKAEVVDRQFDPLGYIVKRARTDNALRVEAWIVANRIWKGVGDPRPSDPRHVMSAHPEWLLRNADEEIRDRGAGDSVYLDPSVPAAREYVARVAADIARNYQVDAIHLDYIRYPGGAWGLGADSLRRYRDDTGRSAPPRHEDPQFIRWRADQVVAQVRAIRNAVRLANPRVELTAATLSWGTLPKGGYHESRGYLDACQDWPAWCEQGLIDAAYVMHYKREAKPDQRTDFRNWLREFGRIRSRGTARIVVGIGSYLNDSDGNRAQERAALESGLDGFAHFSYANPVKKP